MIPPSTPDPFTDSGFFVLRTPLLPIEELLQLAPSGLGTSRAEIHAALRRWAERAEVRQALWIASPELLESLPTLWEQPESAKGRRLEQALYRYLARMTARCTPFGTFAGCSTGNLGGATRLTLSPRGDYRLRTRLDMEALCGLAERLSADPALRGRLRFRTNPSAHRVGERHHHARLDHQDGVQALHLIATEATPAVDATLARAEAGATAEDLAGALMAGDPEIRREEADAFLAQLIDSRLLVSGLQPPITGHDPILYMADQLDQAQAADTAAGLRTLAEELRSLDQQGLGLGPDRYAGIAARLEGLGGAFKPGHLVQVDLIKPAMELSLDRRLVDGILAAVQALHGIQGRSGPDPLLAFKEQFRSRYQDLEVALLDALDDEAGIGFEPEDNPTAEPLIAGIEFRPAEHPSQEPDRELPPILARRLEALRAAKGTVLTLDAELLEELKAPDPLPMPDAFTILGTAFQGPDQLWGFHLRSAFGPSGANLLTRFCHDEDLSGRVQAHVRAEEVLESGSVFAEIVHLPEGRVGNVVCRPALRAYEIPLMATPGVPKVRQIPLSDLTVSLRSDRIVLRSRRLGAEIQPRLTTAHAFAGPRNWKLYKFLCLLQHQGTCPELFFDWGAAGSSAFLPRVVLGQVVVAPARWRIGQETSQDLAQGRVPVQQWREANQVPRFAFIAEGDQQLLIDFENPLAVDTFTEFIRKQDETVVVEMFPGPEAMAVEGPEGRFVHELILPCLRARPRPPEAAPPQAPAEQLRAEASGRDMARAGNALHLEPGSEWIFAKLYCSPSHADVLLQDLVRPLVAEVLSAGAADRWFYIRYIDPEWHLRLRFHGSPAALNGFVLPTLTRAAERFQRERTLWRLQLDTYEPEVERYGGLPSLGLAEQAFQLDSELCLELLPLALGDAGAELRWQLAFCGADRLLAGLGIDLEEKLAVVEQLRSSRESSWTVDGDYRQQLARTFRAVQGRSTLASMLDELEHGGPGRGESLIPPEALAAWRRYGHRLEGLRAKWEELQRAGRMTVAMPELASSLVHMHLNRMLRACHLEQEAVICDFLARTYSSRLARRRRE